LIGGGSRRAPVAIEKVGAFRLRPVGLLTVSGGYELGRSICVAGAVWRAPGCSDLGAMLFRSRARFGSWTVGWLGVVALRGAKVALSRVSFFWDDESGFGLIEIASTFVLPCWTVGA
jgi:hypothetical protein